MRHPATEPGDVLFLETTRRYAPPGLAASDVRIALELLQPAPGARLADLGCGYGRHLRAFAAAGFPAVLGVDRSALLLDAARREAPAARLVRADLRALPLRPASLDGAACFYSSMFLGTDEDARAALAEAARALRPGAGLVLTTDNPVRLAARPRSELAEDVPGLGHVAETSAWDAARSVDCVTKTLRRPSGEELSATFRIRYYPPPALAALASGAGLQLIRLEPDAPLGEQTPQLVALLRRAP